MFTRSYKGLNVLLKNSFLILVINFLVVHKKNIFETLPSFFIVVGSRREMEAVAPVILVCGCDQSIVNR